MKSYELLTLQDAEAMSLDEFAELPLPAIEHVVRQYAGYDIRLSETPHKANKGKICPKGHLYATHGERQSNGNLVCRACRHERRRRQRMDRKAA